MVLLRPDQEATSAYRKVQREFFNLKDRLVANRDLPALSCRRHARRAAGQHQQFWPIAQAAHKVGRHRRRSARTEYLFLTHHDVPGEEEQYEYYRQIIVNSPNQTVTIRNSRPGAGIKPCRTSVGGASPTPSWVGARPGFSSKARSFSSPRSAPSCAPGRPRSCLDALPHDHDPGELLYVNNLGQGDAATISAREGVAFGEDVKTGVMVEVPAAAICIDALLRPDRFSSRSARTT